jgi:hypothetical protein
LSRTYCTVLSSAYLFRVIALHESMMRRCAPFRLVVICFDRRAQRILEGMELAGVEVVSGSELEASDRDLAAARADRSFEEYTHTAKPSAILHLFGRRPEVDLVTYIDADLFFFENPAPIFEEMGGASILITPHRFSPEFEGGRPWGIYNGGMVGFRRDRNGFDALRWWRERCLEWCHIRLEKDRAGDQKYLNDWPERFEGVHVLQHKGGHVAPWNITQYSLANGNGSGRLTLDGDPLICFHFQGSILRKRTLPRGDAAHEPHSLPYFQPAEDVAELIYAPYFAEIDRAVRRVRRKRPFFAAGLTRHQ